MAYVLCYELLLGEGLKPHGPAERVVLAAEGELRVAAGGLTAEAGVDSLVELLEESPGVQHPRTARVSFPRVHELQAISLHVWNRAYTTIDRPGWQCTSF